MDIRQNQLDVIIIFGGGRTRNQRFRMLVDDSKLHGKLSVFVYSKQ